MWSIYGGGWADGVESVLWERIYTVDLEYIVYRECNANIVHYIGTYDGCGECRG